MIICPKLGCIKTLNERWWGLGKTGMLMLENGPLGKGINR